MKDDDKEEEEGNTGITTTSDDAAVAANQLMGLFAPPQQQSPSSNHAVAAAPATTTTTTTTTTTELSSQESNETSSLLWTTQKGSSSSEGGNNNKNNRQRLDYGSASPSRSTPSVSLTSSPPRTSSSTFNTGSVSASAPATLSPLQSLFDVPSTTTTISASNLPIVPDIQHEHDHERQSNSNSNSKEYVFQGTESFLAAKRISQKPCQQNETNKQHPSSSLPLTSLPSPSSLQNTIKELFHTINDKFCQSSSLLSLSLSSSMFQPTTIAGSFMFLLYHVVFALANGSAIIRPSTLQTGGLPILGSMAKWTSVGIFISCPFLIRRLGKDIPALYPSVDLFLAPFLAEAAKIIDQSIVEDHHDDDKDGIDDNDNDNNNDNNLTTTQQQQQQQQQQEYEQYLLWFGSFAVLTGIGMALAGSFLVLASKFKLANLGTYLPFSVLCGFFSAVGVLMWALAFSVDTSGLAWKIVFFSGNPGLIWNSLIHHCPSLIVGILMNRLGPKNPFFVILLIIATIIFFYIVMACTGTTLQEAQNEHWFWSYDELATTKPPLLTDNDTNSNDGIHHDTLLPSWMLPSTPFGAWASIINGYVSWKAVLNGLHNMIALAFLYLLRSSIHASALKKNVNNLVRRIPMKKHSNPQQIVQDEQQQSKPKIVNVIPEVDNEDDDFDEDHSLLTQGNSTTDYTTRSGLTYNQAATNGMVQSMRDQVDIVTMSLADITTLRGNNLGKKRTCYRNTGVDFTVSGLDTSVSSLPPPQSKSEEQQEQQSATLETEDYIEFRPKPSQRTLEEIFTEYGYALFCVFGVGGFGCCPTVATSNTMYAIGAGDPAPQYGSVLLLLIFYFTDFEIVRFIPKTAFSSLLVLGAVDTIVIWFIGPLHKMESWVEWMVVPLIVLFSLIVGFLNAVFLGIGISTFVFVASFFQVGVVKYNASGLEIRSTIERSLVQSIWLDAHGDSIQVIVLQNYLFFGNASSILSYIATMFEDIDLTRSARLDFAIPPVPCVLVVDLSLITGMDTSTVDIFGEIRELCKNNDCKLYLCGLSPRAKKAFAKAGIKPVRKGPRSKRSFLFFADLDSGLGKAEDVLIQEEMKPEDVLYHPSPPSLLGSAGNREPKSGFQKALQHIDDLHGIVFAEELIDLEPYTKKLVLLERELLYERDGTGGRIPITEHGLFFIEKGMVRIEHDSTDMTLTRTRSYLGTTAMSKIESMTNGGGNTNSDQNSHTLKGQHARLGSGARREALAKRAGQSQPSFRTARMGPGWIIGTYEYAAGHPPLGAFRAITSNVVLYHLPFKTLRTLEQDQPTLVLRLYKVLAHTMARKETNTVAQLTTLHNILSSPAHSKPLPRVSALAMVKTN